MDSREEILQFITAEAPPPAWRVRRVAGQVSEMSCRIYGNYNQLQAIVTRHGETIQRRWNKKSTAQRQKVLLDAWPGMPPKHRPDVRAFRELDDGTFDDPSGNQQGQGARIGAMIEKNRDALIWPYINQEDLSNGKGLLLLLESRSKHTPSEFVVHDSQVTLLATMPGVAKRIDLSRHTMILNNVVNPAEYGKLISWHDDGAAFSLIEQGRQWVVSVGCILLMVQDRLMAFLVKCCIRLLHDIPRENLMDDNIPLRPLIPLPDDRADGFTPRTAMVADAPYRSPFKCNLADMEKALSALASAKSDHYWALQEDPGYFADCLLDQWDHRVEHVRASDGSVHPSRFGGILGGAVINTVIERARDECSCFSALHCHMTAIRSLHDRFMTSAGTGDSLADKYIDEISSLKQALFVMRDAKIAQLKYSTPCSPPLRSYCVRELSTDVDASEINIRFVESAYSDRARDEMLWLLQVLWAKHDQSVALDYESLVDELDRSTRSDRFVKDMFSSYVADIISDLAVITECQRQLEYHQLWLKSHYGVYSSGPRTLRVYSCFLPDSLRWHDRNHTETIQQQENMQKLGDSVGSPRKHFEYPVEKRRTRTNVEILRRAEGHLKSLWYAVYMDMPRSQGWSEHFEHFSSIQGTPEWVEPADPEAGGQEVPTAVTQSLTDLHLDLARRTEATLKNEVEEPEAKTKVKTRGVPGPGTHSATQNEEEEPEIAPIASIAHPVNPRSLETFKMLFFDPETTSTPGEVPWKDFLHTMTHVGFAAEKQYGSAWQFRPVTSDRQEDRAAKETAERLGITQPIIFHEPHPEKKLGFRVARQVGRRLTRAYGWDCTTFVLKEKK